MLEGRNVASSTGANGLGTGHSSIIRHSIGNARDSNKYSYRVGVSGKKKAIFTSVTIKSEGADV